MGCFLTPKLFMQQISPKLKTNGNFQQQFVSTSSYTAAQLVSQKNSYSFYGKQYFSTSSTMCAHNLLVIQFYFCIPKSTSIEAVLPQEKRASLLLTLLKSCHSLLELKMHYEHVYNGSTKIYQIISCQE